MVLIKRLAETERRVDLTQPALEDEPLLGEETQLAKTVAGDLFAVKPL